MVGSSDPSWRERYWFASHDVVAADTVLTCGFGHYPNQDVQEAFVALGRPDQQRNLRLSRTLGPRTDEISVGPFSIEVIEPFEELRLVLDDNPSGIAFDLRWHGWMEPILEDRHFQVHRQRAIYDAIRYVQHGRLSGELRTPDGDQVLTPEVWWGERDHSWGTRTLPRVQGGPPGLRPEWTLLMFCPFQLPDFGVHLYLHEKDASRPLHLSAAMTPRLGATDSVSEPPVVDVEHDLTWIEGGLITTLDHGTITLILADGRKEEFHLRTLPGRAHLRGGGYEGWNGWLQGHWKGDDTLEHDVWDLTDRSQLYRYAKASSDHLIEVRHGDDVGYGIIEYMVLAGHQRYAHAIPPRLAH